MITKKRCYDVLISLTLVSFAIFGSLSHVFCLGLILIVLSTSLTAKNSLQFESKSIVLYFALAGCFFLFLMRGIYGNNFVDTFASISPMLSIL